MTRRRGQLEGFVEIDLTDALPETPDGEHVLRLFLTLFGRAAFIADPSGATTLTTAMDRSRAFEAKVTTALAAIVFNTVFPGLPTRLPLPTRSARRCSTAPISTSSAKRR